ncbi:type II secretion system F family protein [Streptomyces sp. ISL-90]|nr:type II secretion system F family protein [Streptomyces sp. ISL-90]
MNTGLLVVGIIFALLAGLALLFLVIAPPPPRVAADRRRAPGIEHVSTLAKVSGRATSTIDSVMSRRRNRLFGAAELELAGVKTEPSGFLIVVVSAASIAALIGAVLGITNGTSILLALLFAALTPSGAKIVLNMRTSKRRARFADQLDDTVQLIAGGLRAGHGLMRALDVVSRDADAPTSEELARVVNETRLGRDLSDSLAVTAQRMRSEDFEWVAQAITINRETGGNLAEVLDHVGETIRERGQIKRQVRSLSAEGRLSGIILIVLPAGLFVLLSFIQPGYISVFFGSLLGIIALIIAFILLVVGSIWMMLSVRVKF